MYTSTLAWLDLLCKIEKFGTIINIKGIETKEILNNSTCFDMNYPIIHHNKREMNYKFLGAECYFICNGDNRVENLIEYNDNILQFSDDGLIFNGAYGPPFNNQLSYIINCLSKDRNNRQAVITIWKQNPIQSKDIRCTISIQFMIRDNKLHSFVNMRSSDIMWGICYDFTVFSFMSLRVLTLLNTLYIHDNQPFISLGNCYFNAASSHLYSRHYELSKSILSNINNRREDYKLINDCINDWNFCIYFLKELMKRGFKAL